MVIFIHNMAETHETALLPKYRQECILKEIEINNVAVSKNITYMDLSNQNLFDLVKIHQLPSNLVNLNLSHNNLNNVPDVVLGQKILRTLDLSFNKIKYFDDQPSFSDNMEHLNMASNELLSPPLWVWTSSPKNLTYLNLSNNTNIFDSFQNGHLENLLQYVTHVKHLVIHNCRLYKYKELLSTFYKAKKMDIGAADFSCFAANFMESVPTLGLDKCCDITSLKLSNSKIYTILPNIVMYKNLKEIDLAMNNINDVPNEFSNLENLETCILSCNHLLYLPDSFTKLSKLKCLLLDNNKICVISKEFELLTGLQSLDLFNNDLYEIPNKLWNIAEIDFDQNYLEEPEPADYSERKNRHRLNIKINNRLNGKKITPEMPESENSEDHSDLNSISSYHSSDCNKEEVAMPSSDEDWDSDSYWVPSQLDQPGPSRNTAAAWISFVNKKIEEGNFCPIDLHTVPIIDKVRYERMCNPVVYYESEGQFDDLTEDDS